MLLADKGFTVWKRFAFVMERQRRATAFWTAVIPTVRPFVNGFLVFVPFHEKKRQSCWWIGKMLYLCSGFGDTPVLHRSRKGIRWKTWAVPATVISIMKSQKKQSHWAIGKADFSEKARKPAMSETAKRIFRDQDAAATTSHIGYQRNLEKRRMVRRYE